MGLIFVCLVVCLGTGRTGTGWGMGGYGMRDEGRRGWEGERDGVGEGWSCSYVDYFIRQIHIFTFILPSFPSGVGGDYQPSIYRD